MIACHVLDVERWPRIADFGRTDGLHFHGPDDCRAESLARHTPIRSVPRVGPLGRGHLSAFVGGGARFPRFRMSESGLITLTLSISLSTRARARAHSQTRTRPHAHAHAAPAASAPLPVSDCPIRPGPALPESGRTRGLSVGIRFAFSRGGRAPFERFCYLPSVRADSDPPPFPPPENSWYYNFSVRK